MNKVEYNLTEVYFTVVGEETDQIEVPECPIFYQISEDNRHRLTTHNYKTMYNILDLIRENISSKYTRNILLKDFFFVNGDKSVKLTEIFNGPDSDENIAVLNNYIDFMNALPLRKWLRLYKERKSAYEVVVVGDTNSKPVPVRDMDFSLNRIIIDLDGEVMLLNKKRSVISLHRNSVWFQSGDDTSFRLKQIKSLEAVDGDFNLLVREVW